MIPKGNTTKTMTRWALNGAFGIIVLGSTITFMGGCRGDRTDAPPRQFFPDMDYQPKFKAQSESKFFEDGHSQRLPVEGTVAFGSDGLIPQGAGQWVEMKNKDRDDMLKADKTYYFGLVAGSTDQDPPAYVEWMPVEVNKELIMRGMERYNIYCAACHGYDGLGNDSGLVGRMMNVRPVNLLDNKYRDRSGEFGADGYLFHIIRDGLWAPDGSNRMPSYKHAIDEQDAWAIVSYIRTLQRAFDAKGRRLGRVNETPGWDSKGQDSEKNQAIASTDNGGGRK